MNRPTARRRPNRFAVCVCALQLIALHLTLMSGSSFAHAQEQAGQPPTKAQSTAQQLETIRTLMEDGLKLFTGGKPLEAAQAFDRGYSQHPYSAFLFNAGVCYEKAGDNAAALAKYKQYAIVDPDAPDIQDVRERIARLEAPPSPPPVQQGEPLAAGARDTSTAGTSAPGAGSNSLRSLVVVETEPPGAPLRVFRPIAAEAPAFERGAQNPGWVEIVATRSPSSLSLAVGRYYVLVDGYQDFNASGTELSVTAGHVHHFKANLSQGVFMAFLRVSANAKGAHLYLDDPKKLKPEWGTAPYGELVAAGEHEVLVELPGFRPLRTRVELQSGDRKEVELRLTRVQFGRVTVRADVAEARVLLDGTIRGRWKQGHDPVTIEAAAGRHRLTVIAEGRKDFEGEVLIPKGQVVPVDVTMIPKYPRGTAWAQAIIGAASIGAGVYFGLESERYKSELEEDRERGVLSTDDSRLQLGFWSAVGADVGFAAGALLGGLATWNFIKDPLPESSLEAEEYEEFFDPLKQRPSAPLADAEPLGSPSPLAQRPPAPPKPCGGASRWTFSPELGRNLAGVSLGARF